MKRINYLLIISAIACLSTLNSLAQEVNVKDKKISEKNKEQNYEISGIYPHVDFGPDALMGIRGVAEDINAALDTLIFKQEDEFKKWVSDINPSKFGNSTFEKSILEIKYETS